MKRAVLLSVCLAALLGLVLSGCAAKANTDNVSLVVRAFGDPMSFNPNTLADDNGYPIFQNIFNRLVKLDTSKNIIPDLAKTWEVSPDGKRITFNLRKDAKWTDGQKVTSKDVKYTYETIKANPSYIMSGRLATLDHIETPDEYTAVFVLGEADVALIAELGWYASFVLPEHLFNNGQKWEDNPASKKPVGSGPFMLGEFVQGQSVTLLPNKNYHEGAPKIGKLIFSVVPDDATAVQAFKNGEIDVLDNVPTASIEELKANPKFRLRLNQFPSPMRILFSMKNDKVKDLALRKAIALSIDREEISKKVFASVMLPEYTMYPSIIKWAANTENICPPLNIDEARRTLEAAGYKADASGFYVRGLTIEVFEGYGYPDTAKLIAASLAKAGIELKVNVSEFNAWADKVATQKKFIMELQGGFMGPDPAALKTRYYSNNGSNWGSYSNPEFDKLVDKAAQTGVKEERAKLYKEAQKILLDDVAFIPIVDYAAYDANSVSFKNLPNDGAGKWGWQEYAFTEKVK